MMRNTTACAIRVTSITLVQCLNVRSDCDIPIRLDVTITAGEERTVYTVRYTSADQPTSVRYTYDWKWADQ